jgi:hypothetical protein
MSTVQNSPNQKYSSRIPLLYLLLWSQLVGVSTLLLATVGGSGWETRVTLSADHLLAVVFGGKSLERGFDDTTSETEDQVEGRFLRPKSDARTSYRFEEGSGRQSRARRQHGSLVSYLLDVVVAQGPAIFELLASKNQALLIRRDALLVLDLGFDVVDRIRGLDLEGDGLAREGLDEAVPILVSASFFPSTSPIRVVGQAKEILVRRVPNIGRG